MDMAGLLKVRVVRGVNLAFRDVRGSDPYVVLRMAGQKLKTSIKKGNVNPVWNEDLTFSVTDPFQSIKLEVFDKDTFSRDDRMGDVEIDIQPLLAAVRRDLEGIPSGTVLENIYPSVCNSLTEKSTILWKDGKVTQELFLRLKNVESGEVELHLQWIDNLGATGF